MEENLKQHRGSILFLVVIFIIVLAFYFVDKDLGKIFGITGFFVWFLREYLKNWLDKDLEEYKYKLSIESERDKIKYEKLHTERAEIIKEFYKKIVVVIGEVNWLVEHLDYNDKTKEKSDKNPAISKFIELNNFYEINALYFESEIRKKAREMFKILTELLLGTVAE